MNSLQRLCLVAWITVCSASPSVAQLPSSTLLALSRSGATAGETVDLSIAAATSQQEARSLVFSAPGITATLKRGPAKPFSDQTVPLYGQFSVKVGNDVLPGRYDVRFRGRHGLSNPRTFFVSNFKSEVIAASHDQRSPSSLPLDQLRISKATPAEMDYFAIDLTDSIPLKIDLLAQRLDSRLIGQLKLYDADSRLIASHRGTDGIDPIIRTDTLTAGRYVLAVHDFLFRGGVEYHYQVVAQNIDSAQELVPLQSGVHQLPLHTSVRSCTVLEEGFSMPTDSPAPSKIEAPGELEGWFASDLTDSQFEFETQQGVRLAIDVVSDRWGEPTDARMQIQRVEPQESGEPKLHEVLNVDDSQNVGDTAIHLRSKDPMAIFTAPASSTYRLTLRDLDVGQTLRPRQRFCLRIREPNPGFDLVAYRVYPHRDAKLSKPFGSKLFRGGAEAVRVLAVRRDGWTGPIKLTANFTDIEPRDQQIQIHSHEATIAANQNQTQLTIEAPEDASYRIQQVEIVGSSEDGSITSTAVPATVVWGTGGSRNFIRSRLSTGLLVAVSSGDLVPLSINLGQNAATEVKKGETLKLPIELTRRAGATANCVLRARDLPPGANSADVTVAADKDAGTLEIKTTAKTVSGTYSMWVQCETKIKWKPNPEALQRAETYRSHLQSLHDDPAQADKREAIKSAISKADKQVEAAKPQAQEVEQTVFLPSPTFTFRVVDP